MIPISYSSNWKKAKEVMLEIVTRETAKIVKEAEAEIEKIGETYYLPKGWLNLPSISPRPITGYLFMSGM